MINLGLNIERNIPTLIELAKRSGTVLYLDARKVNGITLGINSPLTSSILNLVNKTTSIDLYNFAGTTSDGYAILNDKPVIAFDGIDSYMTSSNIPELDITGTQNFGISAILQISVNQSGYVFSRNDTGYSDVRYGLLYEAGIFKLISSGVVLISSPAISLNTWYRISVIRDNGVLYMILNGVKVGQVASTTSLISASNFRIGCRVNGTSNSIFSGMKLGAFVITKGSKATLHNGTKMMNAIERGFGF